MSEPDEGNTNAAEESKEEKTRGKEEEKKKEEIKCANEACGQQQELPARPLRRCAGCDHVWYCSHSCQKMDWRARHKSLCKKVPVPAPELTRWVAMPSHAIPSLSEGVERLIKYKAVWEAFYQKAVEFLSAHAAFFGRAYAHCVILHGSSHKKHNTGVMAQHLVPSDYKRISRDPYMSIARFSSTPTTDTKKKTDRPTVGIKLECTWQSRAQQTFIKEAVDLHLIHHSSEDDVLLVITPDKSSPITALVIARNAYSRLASLFATDPYRPSPPRRRSTAKSMSCSSASVDVTASEYATLWHETVPSFESLYATWLHVPLI